MKKFYSLLFVCSISVLLCGTAVGCASVTTWEKTGVITYTVNDAEIKRTANGDIELLQHVTLKKTYLPFVAVPAGESDEQRIFYYPGKRKPENTIGCSYRLKPDHKQAIAMRQKNGYLYFDKILSSFDTDVNKLNPADIALMKENPFVVGHHSGNILSFYSYCIPYAVEERKNGEIYLKCYIPLTPRILIPYDQTRSYQEKMEGTGITLLRIAMLPIPLVVDTVTFPLQFLYVILVHGI